MDQWGPYLPERAWGPGADTEEDTLEEAQVSGAFLDGIFGLTNAGGTVSTSFAFWNGCDAQLKERLTSERETLRHGLADPHYRYASCRYRYPHGDAAGRGAFDLRWELAKEQATRLYLRLTAVNSGDAAAELTVALQMWICHPECGALQLQLPGDAGGGGGEAELGLGGCVRLIACGVCRGQSCLHRTETQLETGHRLGSCSTSLASFAHLAGASEPAYRLHYPGEGLLHQVPVFSDRARAFEALIVRSDRSRLVQGEPAGTRAAIVYRLRLAPDAEASLSFLLAREDSGGDGPDWAAVPALMARSAELARAALEAGGGSCEGGGGGGGLLELRDDKEAENARRIAGRACANLLWNRQLCCGAGTSAPDPCLLVVPDKWHRPGVASAWEHGLHALLLARMAPQLGEAELRNRLAYLTVTGELLGFKAAPPAWPLALLELVSLNLPDLMDSVERIFTELLRHLNWWLIERRDAQGRNTLDDGVLGLEQRGWLDEPHCGAESNDSLVWSGFFCAKMVHLAALMQRQELKSLLDLFNAVLSSLRNEAALVGGLFRPSFVGDGSDGKETVTHCYAACGCAFGLTPLLGCTTLAWSAVTDKESSVLLEWLQWLSNEAASADSPSLFVKADANSAQFLMSWISEVEFLQLCGVLFHTDHFLSPYGLRCASKQLCRESGGRCRLTRGRHVISLPWNFLVLEALKCWEKVYGQRMMLDYPTGAGVKLCLHDIILDISRRLLAIFKKFDETAVDNDGSGNNDDSSAMFFEYYDAETGAGLGGSGQTSWSSLIACVAQNLGRQPTLALHTAASMPHSVGRIVPKSSVAHAFRQTLRCSIKLEDFAPDSSFDWSAEDF